VEKSASRAFRRSARSAPGLDDGARPSACGRGAQKNVADQALGRSRGGWSTKIHAATLDENCAVALHLTAGQAHDGRPFEALSESLEADNVLEFAALDKGYDADRLRERLALDGLAAVIPPLRTRSQKLPCNKELYRGRNRVERFFNKLKQFRRLATRYDKLAKTFLAAVCLVAALIREQPPSAQSLVMRWGKSRKNRLVRFLSLYKWERCPTKSITSD
jgi:putative transposase